MTVYPHDLNADLHAHSIYSDGTLTPEALVARACERGVELFALTDHDETSGIARARVAAAARDLRFVAGVEVSVSFAGATVHVVGLDVDPDELRLREGLAHTRSGRMRRAQEMEEGLAKAGIPDALEGALKYAGNLDLVSRTHFARYLVEVGACRDTADVFRRFLTEGKPGFVPHRWASLRDAVTWINHADGLAVIAHPSRYRFTANEEYALFNEFKSLGGAGVEVVTAAHGSAEIAKYAELAVELDLLASRGSDFHAPDESRTDLGRLPDLPGRLRPVWQALEHRVQRAS